jgi:acyl dehydratase
MSPPGRPKGEFRSAQHGGFLMNPSADTPAPATDALLYWEDFPVGMVREFGGVTMQRDDIVRFATEFDPQPFHVDEAAAEQTLYGGLIASGWHTACTAMRMMCDDYLLRSASLGSPGIENLSWLKPVRPGDTLRMRLTVLESRLLRSKPGIGLMRGQHDVINQHGELVMQMRGSGMFRQRPA